MLDANPRDLESLAGLIIATSHYDAALANEHYARLEVLCPPPEEEEVDMVDALELEQAALPKFAGSASGGEPGKRARAANPAAADDDDRGGRRKRCARAQGASGGSRRGIPRASIPRIRAPRPLPTPSGGCPSVSGRLTASARRISERGSRVDRRDPLRGGASGREGDDKYPGAERKRAREEEGGGGVGGARRSGGRGSRSSRRNKKNKGKGKGKW